MALAFLLSVAVTVSCGLRSEAPPDDPVVLDRKRSSWLERLKSRDAKGRAEAAMVIGEMRWFAGEGGPALAAVLAADPDTKIREIAAQALGRIANPRVAVPALLAALKDSDLAVRSAAARSLGDYGPAAREALPVLANRLKEKDEWDVLAAAVALTKIDPARDDGIRRLISLAQDSKDRDVKSLALGGLSLELDQPELLKRHAKTVAPALFAFLKDDGKPEAGDDFQVRLTAVSGLTALGPAFKEAVPHLTAALRDRNKFVRLAAVKALHGIDPTNPGIERTLLAELRTVDALHPDRFNRMDAVVLAGQIGPAAKGAVPDLIALLQDGDKVHVQVREMATLSLGRIGPSAKASLPILTPDFHARDRTHRFKVARAVTGIDPKDARAWDIIRNMAMKPEEDDGIDLRMEALFLLAGNAAERAAVIRTITAALKSPEAFEKRNALSAGGQVYLKREALLWSVQAECAGLLGTCGIDARDAVPTLVEALRHPQVGVRIAAVQALEKIDPAALRAAGIP